MTTQITIKNPSLYRSIQEEVIALLTLIAALLAWQNDFKLLAEILFVKVMLDTLASVIFAIRELKQRETEAGK